MNESVEPGQQSRPARFLSIGARALGVVVIAAFVAAGCAQQPAKPAPVTTAAAASEEDDDVEIAEESGTTAALPNQELTAPLLYEFLVAEIALQRGDRATAARQYLDLARRTRD